MNPEVDQVFSRVEHALQRDFIISSSFQDIMDGQKNYKRISIIFLLQFMRLVLILHSVIIAFIDDNSPWQFYVLNYIHGFGVFGRILAGEYMCGLGLCFLHSCTFFFFEWKAKLTPLTDLRDMFSRLKNPSQEEVKQFTFLLRLVPYIGLLSFLAVALPMTSLNAVGAVVTGYRFHGMMFVLYCSPLLIIFSIIAHYSTTVWIHVHLIIAQSTMYFKIRLNRVDKKLKEIALNRRLSDGDKKEKNTPRESYFIDDVVLDLHRTLNELDQHNQVIKHFLRDQLYVMSGVFIAFFFFLLGDHAWYFRVFVLATMVMITVINAVSFINAAQLYIRILNMAKPLHSCQCIAAQNQRLELIPTAPSTSQGIRLSMVSDLLVLKSKFQVLRMIQRVSSPHLRLGYTVGNGESFSDDTAAAYVSSIFGNTLMFLNAIH